MKADDLAKAARAHVRHWGVGWLAYSFNERIVQILGKTADSSVMTDENERLLWTRILTVAAEEIWNDIVEHVLPSMLTWPLSHPSFEHLDESSQAQLARIYAQFFSPHIRDILNEVTKKGANLARINALLQTIQCETLRDPYYKRLQTVLCPRLSVFFGSEVYKSVLFFKLFVFFPLSNRICARSGLRANTLTLLIHVMLFYISRLHYRLQ